MDRMFESITSRFGDVYDISVLSTSPWVIVLDNFVTDAETVSLLSSVNKWERSTDTGAMNEFGESGKILSSGRTSSNAWCQKECEQVLGTRCYTLRLRS